MPSGWCCFPGGGNFNRFSQYLIGDLLSITPKEIAWLGVTVLVVGGGLLISYYADTATGAMIVLVAMGFFFHPRGQSPAETAA
ncbi:MAG: metal ABC transporter permease [Verrucomicrobiae bacterium]